VSYYYRRSSEPQWVINHWPGKLTNALTLPNHNVKIYTRSWKTRVDDGRYIDIGFALCMNQKKASTAFEILYKVTGNGNDMTTWEPVPVEVFENLFKREDGSWEFSPKDEMSNTLKTNTHVQIEDGHLLFKCNTDWLRRYLGSISQDRMHHTMPGKLLGFFDINLAVALVYKDIRKYTLQDTDDIAKALGEIDNVAWCIASEDANGRSPHQLRSLERIKKLQADLEENERKNQEVMEQAAEAMNLLSSKYGVDVEL